jgi:hypothetical protein
VVDIDVFGGNVEAARVMHLGAEQCNSIVDSTRSSTLLSGISSVEAEQYWTYTKPPSPYSFAEPVEWVLKG